MKQFIFLLYYIGDYIESARTASEKSGYVNGGHFAADSIAAINGNKIHPA